MCGVGNMMCNHSQCVVSDTLKVNFIKVNVQSLKVISLPKDFLNDVQTDVHFVSIDSECRKHSLLIRLT